MVIFSREYVRGVTSIPLTLCFMKVFVPILVCPFVRILNQDLHFHLDSTSTLEDLSVYTFFASIGQDLREKTHFRVTCNDMMGYMM